MTKATVLVYTLFIFFGLLPSLAAFVAMKKGKLTPARYLLFAVILIGFGTLVIAVGTSLLQVVQPYLQPDNPDFNSAKDIALHINVWVYVFPVVSIGLGVNLLTAYLTTESKKRTATLTTGPSRRRR